ncbi:MAG: zinc ribbon domain-containing protein [Oscillospiraceae bacterium]|nr:zinc ribbon domain-containing protein [Oscillospiraceae bacterium]
MAIFSELSKKVQNMASIASEKAQEAASSAKTSVSILAEQREIEKNYKVIGEWFVSEHSEDAPEAVADVVASIAASKARIAELEAGRASRTEEVEASDEKVCPNCGVTSETPFCPQCGTPLK